MWGIIQRRPRRNQETARLTETEVANAVRRFRTLEPFAEAEGLVTNDGFGASISFSSACHRSSEGLGSIELGLRTASLDFRALNEATGWGWSEAMPLLVKSYREAENLSSTVTDRVSDSSGSTHEIELAGGASLASPILGASLKAGHRRARKQERLIEGQSSNSHSYSLPHPLLEMKGVKKAWTLRLTAPETQSLSYFNPDFVRQSILSVPEPSSLNASNVSITLKPGLLQENSDSLVHSLKIVSSSGAWAPLATSRNKQILGELLLSKFLRPLHRQIRLWPKRATIVK